MKKNKLNFLISSAGFSLMEIMVAIGLLGVVGYIGLNQTDILKDANVSMSLDKQIDEMQSSIRSLVIRSESCDFTFKGQNQVRSNIQIKDKDNKTIFQAGKTYLDGKVKISSIETVLVDNYPVLKVAIEKLTKESTSKTITRSTQLLVNLKDGKVEDCFSPKNSVQLTLRYEVARRICEKTYGKDTEKFKQMFDANEDHAPDKLQDPKCFFDGFVEGSAANSCEAGQAITSVKYDAESKVFEPVCDSYVKETVCSNSWIKKVDEERNFECAKLEDYVDITNSISFSDGDKCGLTAVGTEIRVTCSPVDQCVCPSPDTVECGKEILDSCGVKCSSELGTMGSTCTPSCQGEWTEDVPVDGGEPASCKGGTFGGSSSAGSCQSIPYSTNGDSENPYPNETWTETGANHCRIFGLDTCENSLNKYLTHRGSYFSCRWKTSGDTPGQCSSLTSQSSCESKDECDWDQGSTSSNETTTEAYCSGTYDAGRNKCTGTYDFNDDTDWGCNGRCGQCKEFSCSGNDRDSCLSGNTKSNCGLKSCAWEFISKPLSCSGSSEAECKSQGREGCTWNPKSESTTKTVTKQCAGATNQSECSQKNNACEWKCTGNSCPTKTNIVNGLCDTTERDGCFSGTQFPGMNTATAYKWACLGVNGGSTALCEIPIAPGKCTGQYPNNLTKAGVCEGEITAGSCSTNGGTTGGPCGRQTTKSACKSYRDSHLKDGCRWQAPAGTCKNSPSCITTSMGVSCSPNGPLRGKSSCDGLAGCTWKTGDQYTEYLDCATFKSKEGDSSTGFTMPGCDSQTTCTWTIDGN